MAKSGPLEDSTTGILNREDLIRQGEWLYSPNGQYRLGMEHGQMVIQHVPTGNRVDRFSPKDGSATRIRFEYEKGDGEETRLELHNDDDKEIANISDSNSDLHKGEAWTKNWDDPDDDSKGSVQYVLTRQNPAPPQNSGSGSGSGSENNQSANDHSGDSGGNGGSTGAPNSTQVTAAQPLSTTPASTNEDFGSTFDDLLGTPKNTTGSVDSTPPWPVEPVTMPRTRTSVPC
ncbi:hypothetical protein [Nocardia sp. NPDC049707]|uniref:hypothetical protein n=1 Tax=Nocardia sp. NPDC049707 TaxID=3154735 RepID=UPI003420AEAC